MITAIDLQTMITLEPEIIQEYYDSYDMGSYAPAIIELIDLAKSMPEEKTMVAIKNIFQNNDILPPDNKELAISNLLDMGVTPNRALKAVNVIKPIKTSQLPKLISAIRAKIPNDKYSVFENFITTMEQIA